MVSFAAAAVIVSLPVLPTSRASPPLVSVSAAFAVPPRNSAW
jgi:hypothetical protein